jgi:hypothetical protein
MLFLDFSQLTISSVMEYFTRTKSQPGLELVRSIALSNILFHKKKLRLYYKTDQDIFLCIDGRTYWRRGVFPEYKRNRLKAKQDSDFDWDDFFTVFNTLKEEFIENLPFHWIEMSGAEADDIIAVLVKHFCDPRMTNVIVSSDKDFIQLQSICPTLKQFSSWHKKFITAETVGYDFFEHIIKGDKGDGIPNIFSDDDSYMNPDKRCKTIRNSKIDQWRNLSPEEFCINEEVLKKYRRNIQLIDLQMIPKEIETGILETLNKSKTSQTKFFDYLSTHRLTGIMERGF